MKSTDLRPGYAIRMDGKVYVITKTEHRTPGNLRAFMQIKMKDIKAGATIERRFSSSEEVDVVSLDRRDMEYLYSDNTGHVFMDQLDFEQHTVSSELVGDLMGYIKPNTAVVVLVMEGQLVSIDLPKTVDLIVTETAPGIKGATATNQLKEATLETGLKTRVPDFIKQGETIRISTDDGSYLSRA